MKFFIFSFLFLSSWCLACEVRLPHHVIVLGEGMSSPKNFEAKNCDDKTLIDLGQVMSTLEGKIPTQQIAEIVSQKGNISLKISPVTITVQHLKSLIREQLLIPSGIQIKGTRALNTSNFLTLNPGDKLTINCSPCFYSSQQTINLNISSLDGNKISLAAAVHFARMVRAYKVLSALPSFSEISNLDNLKEEYVEAIPHTELLTDLENLKFYRTNKPLRAGDLLKRSDLNPINLVKAGLNTEVIIESQVVRIKTHGISRNNGSLGEVVEVFHPQKNKKYQGKVIDINKVLVEL